MKPKDSSWSRKRW